MIRKLRNKLYRGAYNTAGKAGSCKIEDTIVLAGSPRSGTTLLLEVLLQLPGYKAINEPLIRHRTQVKHGFEYRTYLPQGKFTPQQHDFLEQVLRGQMSSSARWLFKSDTHFGRLIEHTARKKLVVKFCRINRMLPQFANRFDVRGIVFIVRHPCAVVNSMLRYGQWKNWDEERIQKSKNDPSSAIYIGHLPDEVQEVFAPILKRVSTHTEVLTLFWCLDHYLPFIYEKNHPWILLPYEKLIMQSFEELTRITEALGIVINNEMLNTMSKPSSSVKEHFHKNGLTQISKWKHQLTARQIDDILTIVDNVGLSVIYSDKLEPDYDYFFTPGGTKSSKG